jgi:hypothetical protein
MPPLAPLAPHQSPDARHAAHALDQEQWPVVMAEFKKAVALRMKI